MKFTYAAICTLVLMASASANAEDVKSCAYQVSYESIQTVRNTIGYKKGQQINTLYDVAAKICRANPLGLDNAAVQAGVNQAIAESLTPTR